MTKRGAGTVEVVVEEFGWEEVEYWRSAVGTGGYWKGVDWNDSEEITVDILRP
jgi:hypothetical protein